MAAPAHTARTTPATYQLPDGFHTTIAFALKSNIQFWEATVKPGSIDAGGAINNTTMFNLTFRTKRAPALREHGNITGRAAYDPDVATEIEALVGKEGSITVMYSTGDYKDFYGFLNKVEWEELKEKEFPMLAYEIVETDWDPVNHQEVGPTYVAAAGT